MTEASVKNRAIFCALFLAFLGEMPLYNNLAALPLLLSAAMAAVCFSFNRLVCKRWFCLAAIPVTFFGFLTALLPLCVFFKKEVLPKTGLVIITAAILLCVGTIFFCKKDCILKLSTVGFVITAVFLTALLLILLLSADFKNIKDIKPFLKGSYYIPIISLLPVSTASATLFKDTKLKTKLSALCLAVLLLLLLFFAAFSVSGERESIYPILFSVKLSAVGNFFTRTDGFFYAAVFICGIIKSSVCITATVDFFKKVLYN